MRKNAKRAIYLSAIAGAVAGAGSYGRVRSKRTGQTNFSSMLGKSKEAVSYIKTRIRGKPKHVFGPETLNEHLARREWNVKRSKMDQPTWTRMKKAHELDLHVKQLDLYAGEIQRVARGFLVRKRLSKGLPTEITPRPPPPPRKRR